MNLSSSLVFLPYGDVSRFSEIADSDAIECSFIEGFSESEVVDALWLQVTRDGCPFAIAVDAHCPFSEMASFARVLSALGRRLKAESVVAQMNILFLSEYFDSSTPPLDAESKSIPQNDSADDLAEAVTRLRQNQFYLRMFDSYGWSFFAKIDRVEALLGRLRNQPNEFGCLNTNELMLWNNDISRIWEVIEKQLRIGVWVGTARKANRDKVARVDHPERFYPGLTEDSCLEAMALCHQFRRVDSHDAEELMSSSNISLFSEEIPTPPRLNSEWNSLTLESMHIWESHRQLWCETTRQGERKSKKRLKEDLEKASSEKRRVERKLVLQAGKRNEAQAKRIVFDLLEDAAQILSKGCARWAEDASIDSKPLRVLAVKDYVKDDIERERLNERFNEAFHAAFRDGTVELHCVSFDNNKNQPWDTHEWWLKRIQKEERVRARDHLRDKDLPQKHFMSDYDIIIIEAEYENRFVGPSIIQWLDKAFDEDRGNSSDEKWRRPQTLILSRDENAGHSFLCLWLGAQAYASKSRVLGIPSLLTMANVGRLGVQSDRKRLRPNFYAVDGLLPHQRNRLQSSRARDLIVGDDWDRWWVESLPKADLHYHIGTSISISAIEAMAANTAGYTCGATATDSSDSVQEVVDAACKIVMLASLARVYSSGARELEPYRLLWGISRFLLLPRDENGGVVDKEPPEMGALDRVVQWLSRPDRPVRQYEACAILVTAIAVFESREGSRFDGSGFRQKVNQSWLGLRLADSLFGSNDGKDLNSEICNGLWYLLERIGSNWSDVFTRNEVQRVIGGAAKNSESALATVSEAAIRRCKIVQEAIAESFDSLVKHPDWVRRAMNRFTDEKAEFLYGSDDRLINEFLADSAKAVSQIGDSEALSLKELVQIPEATQDGKQRSLARYLTGCDLLGAEHLQFPENLLLAGLDLTRQNAIDNVVYSEVRCSTQGYCKGGMNVFDATDLLCVGFDVGALLFGGFRQVERSQAAAELGFPDDVNEFWSSVPKRWIRTNILLGAKRHKKGDVSTVVPLVVEYLERGREVERFRIPTHRSRKAIKSLSHDIPGRWWRRASVVGFDLSGNEHVRRDNLHSAVQPLFAACAFITIHAGEAMSAHSIWDAVHNLGAQRIGHGLRLRENMELLEHCVNRGICMELCPISNSFTNIFEDAVAYSQAKSHTGRIRDGYPIRDFWDAGLDVCINTDNRSIHNKSCLTDEYLRAAQMCGGFSRWDVLRLCKAGFKNAFLPKDEVAAILRHVEYEVYKSTCEHSGEKHFPSVEYATRS